MITENLNARIEELLISYYTDYYKETLGLPDYEERIKNRLNEEALHAKHINKIEVLSGFSFDSKKVLVVGGGTGGEFIALSRRGGEAYALEPDFRALEILRLKTEREGLAADRVRGDYAENISYPDNYFDFVYCHTVLEHVADAGKAISEIVRVAKQGGKIYISCPDYRHVYEPHYKTYLPLFMPRFIIRMLLKLKGRPTEFLDTLQFLTANKLRNIFRNNNVIAMQTYFPYSEDMKFEGWNRITRILQDKFGIARDQYWVLIKN